MQINTLSATTILAKGNCYLFTRYSSQSHFSFTYNIDRLKGQGCLFDIYVCHLLFKTFFNLDFCNVFIFDSLSPFITFLKLIQAI